MTAHDLVHLGRLVFVVVIVAWRFSRYVRSTRRTARAKSATYGPTPPNNTPANTASAPNSTLSMNLLSRTQEASEHPLQSRDPFNNTL